MRRLVSFHISQAGVIINNRAFPSVNPRSFYGKLLSAILFFNNLAVYPDNRIESVQTSIDGHLIFVCTKSGRVKEFFNEGTSKSFANFLVAQMASHSIGWEFRPPSQPFPANVPELPPV